MIGLHLYWQKAQHLLYPHWCLELYGVPYFEVDLKRLEQAMLQFDPERWRPRHILKPSSYAHKAELVAALAPIEMIEVLKTLGHPDIGDGRHRSYALMDAGYTSFYAMMDPDQDLSFLVRELGVAGAAILWQR